MQKAYRYIKELEASGYKYLKSEDPWSQLHAGVIVVLKKDGKLARFAVDERKLFDPGFDDWLYAKLKETKSILDESACQTQITISGWYTEEVCQRIQDRLNGKSYLEFQITYSNENGNCAIIVSSDQPHTTRQELGELFTAMLIEAVAGRV